MTTPIDTAALRALLAEATPGPWFASYSSIYSEPLARARQEAEDSLTDASPDAAWDALPTDHVAAVPIRAGDTPTVQGARDEAAIVALRNAAPALLDAADERDRLRAALDKINAIRNSIVGRQKVNWSEHIYPLVAALNDAGIVGQPYAEARSEVGTLLARAVSAEAESAALRDERDRLRSELSADEIRECNAESEPPPPRRLAHLMCALEGMDREEFVTECFTIALALPNAKIIDARRHPLASPGSIYPRRCPGNRSRRTYRFSANRRAPGGWRTRAPAKHSTAFSPRDPARATLEARVVAPADRPDGLRAVAGAPGCRDLQPAARSSTGGSWV